jgi:hypothetical protein
MSTELGLRNVAFEGDELRLVAESYGLIGGVGHYEHVWRMAYVRGPEGIIVVLGQGHRLNPPLASRTAYLCWRNPSGLLRIQSKLSRRPEG